MTAAIATEEVCVSPSSGDQTRRGYAAYSLRFDERIRTAAAYFIRACEEEVD